MIKNNHTLTQIDFSKYLPHNFLAEKIVLSCLLYNSNTISTVIKYISLEKIKVKQLEF